ncbi:MAG: hypothetical protein JJ855_07885 [Rhodospirillales bacterium]|nr:hypothetical protein [Rhodospirillales bacterium]
MAFDDLDAEIAYLMDVMEGEQGDLREIEFRLRQVISTLRAEGLPVPEDLKKLEADLDRLLQSK